MRHYVVATSYAKRVAHDIVRITPPPLGGVCYLVELHVTFGGMAGSERARIALFSGSTDGAGTSTPPVPVDPGDPAFLGSCATNLTSIATKGDAILREHVDTRAGYHLVPPKPSRFAFSGSTRFVGRLGFSLDDPGTIINLAVVIGVEG